MDQLRVSRAAIARGRDKASTRERRREWPRRAVGFGCSTSPERTEDGVIIIHFARRTNCI